MHYKRCKTHFQRKVKDKTVVPFINSVDTENPKWSMKKINLYEEQKKSLICANILLDHCPNDFL